MNKLSDSIDQVTYISRKQTQQSQLIKRFHQVESFYSPSSTYFIQPKNNTFKHDVLSTETLVPFSPYFSKTISPLSVNLKSESFLPNTSKSGKDPLDILISKKLAKYFTSRDTFPHVFESEPLVAQKVVIHPPLDPLFCQIEIVDQNSYGFLTL